MMMQINDDRGIGRYYCDCLRHRHHIHHYYDDVDDIIAKLHFLLST